MRIPLALAALGVLLGSVVLICFAFWRLLRRAGIPAWFTAVFLVAGAVMVLVSVGLWVSAHPVLFPETSPCWPSMEPETRWFPPDSHCRHADGELRSVNGARGKAVFWIAFGVVTGTLGVAAARRVRR
ncbi:MULTISPECIES: hypothetical protein [Streptomyces]|uniref:Uncharacterized protein n=2 Tax=Streptomyces TaxID=1883 RepID=A0A286E1D5_9ACTN|nr:MULTISPECIES: hypothetical protein [Streptomyces]TNM28518.1 hypothetical protein FH715_18390 [Streptomyces sedi]SOD64701.1 hypothetical protein SAMN06297387_11927 [Streptomyces zhaozhouensis]